MKNITLAIKSMYQKIALLFSKKKIFIKPNPIEYKNNNMWGDCILIDKSDNYFNIKGHGFKQTYLYSKFPEIGDFFLVNMESGEIAMYVFTEIRRVKDPSDMFFFKATFVKYKEVE